LKRALLALIFVLAIAASAFAQKPLPPLHDGAVIAGPGEFRHDGELFVQAKVTLSNMTLNLHGPIRVAAGASLELDDVHLVISDPDGAANGTSGLRCDGPARVVIRHSTMAPVGSAHPMWGLQGDLDVDGFATVNSEFHLKHVQARLNQFKIFELEISEGSQVTAHGVDLVFLSTHSSDDDHLHFANIPVNRAFTQTLDLGSGAHAHISDSRMQMFLLYVHGHSEATLAHIDRVQLALSPDCEGTLRLPHGRVGTEAAPVVIPSAKSSNCPFHISLDDVNVDTWDIYASGHAKLQVEDSQIDELILSDHANVVVRNSNVYADWLGVSGDASVTVSGGTVGALRLAKERPDLATSEIHMAGRGRAAFSGVRFDCGIVAADDAQIDVNNAVVPPKYARHAGNSSIRMNPNAGSGSQ
jgi:hypothetical protein